MNADQDDPGPFADLNAMGALRAAFKTRDPSSVGTRRSSATAQAWVPAECEGYELEGEIARGGMGVIVKAFDRELTRDVALKVLRDELGSEPRLVRRFVEEARITARLDHPGIVPVYQAGTDSDGRAYFAMRLVRGRDLRRIIELANAGEEGWSQTRALSVMLKVCEAMAYAHRKNVIHRDLKPSNVMVGEFGEVYVMDWGLARVIGDEDAHDLRLRVGSGVPAGADEGSSTATLESSSTRAPASSPTRSHASSPTRAPAISPTRSHASSHTRALASSHTRAHASSHTGSDASFPDGLADVDSPIVTMDGEVLGTPCYMSPEQALGRIAELGPAADVYSVGAMLYHLLAGEMPYVPAGTSVASREVLMRLVQHAPRALSEVRRDLPAELVAICDKAMSREPEDRYASMLAMAEDVRAFLERRVVHAYETGALAETRKWVQRNKPLAAALASVVVALVVGLIVSLSLKARSDSNFVRAEKVASFLKQTLGGVKPSVAAGRDTTMLREMMDASYARIEKGELAEAPEAELGLLLVIGNAYRDIARYDKAEPVLRRALEKANELAAGDDPFRAQAMNDLGLVLLDRSDFTGAEPLLRGALEMNTRLFPGDHVKVALVLGNLAGLLQARGDFVEAEGLYRRQLEMHQRLFSADHEDTAVSMNNLATVMAHRGDVPGAEKLCRAALEMEQRIHSGDDPEVATNLDTVGVLLQMQGDLAGAEPLHRRALEMRRRLYTGDHPLLATTLDNLGVLLYARGDLSGAEQLLREALEMRRRLFHGDQAELAQLLMNLGMVLGHRGDPAGAEPLLREALAMHARLFPGGHPETATTLESLAGLMRDRGDLEQAEALQREALEMRQRLQPGDHLETADSSRRLAALLETRGEFAGAEMLDRDALRMIRALARESDTRISSAAVGLGRVLTKEKRFAEADQLLTDAARVAEKRRSIDPNSYRECVLGLVQNCKAWEAAEPNQGHADRAAEWEQGLTENGK